MGILKQIDEEMKKEREKVIPKNYFYKPIFIFVMILILLMPIHFYIEYGFYNYYAECSDLDVCINPMYICKEPLERECITQEQYNHNIQYINGNFPNPEKKYISYGDTIGIKTPDYIGYIFVLLVGAFSLNQLIYMVKEK